MFEKSIFFNFQRSHSNDQLYGTNRPARLRRPFNKLNASFYNIGIFQVTVIQNFKCGLIFSFEQLYGQLAFNEPLPHHCRSLLTLSAGRNNLFTQKSYVMTYPQNSGNCVHLNLVMLIFAFFKWLLWSVFCKGEVKNVPCLRRKLSKSFFLFDIGFLRNALFDSVGLKRNFKFYCVLNDVFKALHCQKLSL